MVLLLNMNNKITGLNKELETLQGKDIEGTGPNVFPIHKHFMVYGNWSFAGSISKCHYHTFFYS